VSETPQRAVVRNERTLRFRVLSWLGRLWDRVERLFGRLARRASRQRRQIAAEARLLEAEVLQLGARLLDHAPPLGFTPASFKVRPIRTQFYGHGGFMGAAPALLADDRFRRILAFLMPDVFAAVRDALESDPDPTPVMPMMENNPVAAAFGVLEGTRRPRPEGEESPHHLAGIEWDLFFDGALLERWEAVRAAPDQLAAILEEAIDTSLIAHADARDTVQEALGLCQYADVRKTPKTALGGVEIDAWLDLFARALALGAAADPEPLFAEMAKEPRVASDEPCMQHTFARCWPALRCVEVFRELTGRSCFSVILDVKSLRSTPEFLADFVRALNARGIHVSAVGSFLRDETVGLSAVEQRLDGALLPGPRELQFFHFAGDLQAACDAGRVERGQSVLFNGASLLDVTTHEGGAPTYSTKLRVLAELEAYRRRFDLHIGYYVQEGDCDHAAAALLSDLSEARPDTFELGFAWGGLRDEVHLPTSEVPRLGYGSQRALERIGRARQWQLGAS
jgi:hypothetical protein